MANRRGCYTGIDLTGRVFERLTVLRLSSKKSNGCRYWTCLCSCGNEKDIRTGNLVNRNTRSCGCLSKEWDHKTKGKTGMLGHYKGCGEVYASYWWKVGHGARRRGLDLDVTIEYVAAVYDTQNGYCALSGIPLSFSNKTASLDRIDNTKGYVEGNLQWVHKTINTMKNSMTDQEFISWCDLVVSNKEVSL